MADPAAARRYERIDIHLRCRLFIPEPQEGKKHGSRLRFEAFADSKNLGLGGLFVQSAFQLKQNVQVTVELHLPNGPLAISSRVAHVVGPGEPHTPGMGIEFLNVDSHGRETLLRYFTPPAYGEFHRAMIREFPHLDDDFGLQDVSLLINLWEESRAKRGPPPAPSERRRPSRGR
jgi:PilZ domain